MAINFNTEPYYDDYNEDKKFYRILFKPGVSVQARELTQMQAIIQKQVERHGRHIFKEGSRVSGGEFSYTNKFYAIKLQGAISNKLIPDFIDQFVDVTLQGETSGVTARVVTYTEATADEPNTLFVTYTSTGDDKTTNAFIDGENLISVGSVVNGIPTGTPVAQLLSSNANAIGASAKIERGVYFVKDHFVLVDSQRIILDKYTNNPSYRVGLEIVEEIISADEDQSLLDTAQNAPNFSARGADRYTINLVLATRDVDSEDDGNFIELERINEGRLQAKVKTSEYSELETNMARRTYDESGDYVVKPFQIKAKETLNNGINNGVYFEGSTTDSGNVPSDDLLTLQISTGKAYIRGYEISLNQPAFIDIPKPRDFVEVDSSSSSMDLGNFVRVNNVFGSPEISTEDVSLNSFNEVGLFDTITATPGNKIGVARARSFELEAALNGSADVFGPEDRYRLFLFDIKMFTELGLLSQITIPAGAHGSMVRGVESQAYGFLNSNSGTSNVSKVYLTSVVGDFRPDEELVYSYDNYTTPFADTSSVVVHAFENVKQTFMVGSTSATGADYNFSSNIVLESSFQLSGSANISGTSVVGLNAYYTSELKVGDALSLPTGTSGSSETRYVIGISNNTVTLNSAVTNSVNSVTLFRLRAFINDQEKHILIRRLDKEFTRSVSDVDLTVRRQYIVESNNSSQITLNAGTSQTFRTVNNIDYSIVVIKPGAGSTTSAGDVINVDNVGTSGEGTGQLILTDASMFGSSGTFKVIATLNKVGQTQKTKIGREASAVEVLQKSAESNVVYGTSSKHRDISLGVSDVTRIVAIYESTDSSTAPLIPKITVGSVSGSFSRGELVRGQSSGAVGLIIDTISPIRYVSQNSIGFQVGETVVGIESDASATVSSTTKGDKIVTNNYLLDSGQRDNYYDIAKITRKVSAPIPNGRLAVIFDYFDHTNGDFFTVNSYSSIDYTQIPTYSATRIDPEIRNPNGVYDLRSVMDFRPRVANSSSTTSSGVSGAKVVTGYSFDFESRSYSGTGSSRVAIPADNSSINYDYSYFLARIDSVFMTSSGRLKVVQGIPDESPKTPPNIESAMRLADISMPAYVLDIEDISVARSQQRRYTMQDIGRLEGRINNIEYYTSLSLLEKSAEVLQIKDANGLDRFKSGFLVDNFGGHKTGDVLNRDYRCAIDMANRVLRPKYKMRNITLSEVNITPESRLANHYVSDDHIVTLPYDEIESITQPYATRVENLNPVLNFAWSGSLKLEPSSDEWFEIERLPDVVNNVQGNFDTIVAQNKNAIGTIWNAAVTDWTGILENTRATGNAIRVATWNPDDIGKSPRPQVAGGRGQRRLLQRQVADEVGVQTRAGIETTIIEQIDVTSDGDRLVAESLIPYMRSRDVLFEARGLKPLTRVYPFFDKVNVSQFVLPTSGAIIPKEGEGTIPQTAATWDKIKVIQISYDNNSNKEIDIVMSRTNDIKKPETWNSGVQKVSSLTLHNHTGFGIRFNSSNRPQINAFVTKNPAAFSSIVDNGTWINLTLNPSYRFTGDNKLKGWRWIDSTEIRIWAIDSSTSTNGFMQYKDSSGNWVKVSSKNNHCQIDLGLNASWSEDNDANQVSSAFHATSTTRSTNRTVTEFNFEDAPLAPSQFGEGFYRFRFYDRNSNNALSGLQISEILFFSENYGNYPSGLDAADQYEWNIENALIPNVNHSELVASYNMKSATSLIDGGTIYQSDLGKWVIDGVNYDSDRSGYSEATIASAGKGEGGVDIRVRGGTRTVDNTTGVERFSAPGTQQGDALVTDAGGFVSGIFTIPDPNVSGNPVFETGERLFRLSSDASNGTEAVQTFAQSNYTAKGVLQQKQETFSATRNGVMVTQEVSQETTVTRQRDLGLVQVGWYDPLAQSIMPSTTGGEFITSIDVFFSNKDDFIPVTCQLREMVNGLPTTKVIPFASKTLQPEDVNISNDGSVATNFKFDAPVFLNENVEVCIVLATDSDKYLAWISVMGETDVLGSRTVSEQPYLGVLFKSQNNSTWTAYDYEDLKFTVYRASFDISKNGIVELENEEIPMDKLASDPLKTISGTNQIIVTHDDHGMYDVSPGTGNYTLIDGVVSGITGTLNADMDIGTSSFIIDGAVDAGFPVDSGPYSFIIRTDISIEAEDQVVIGTVSVVSDVYTINVTGTTISNKFSAGATVEFYELNGIPLDKINNVSHKVTQATIDSYVIEIPGEVATGEVSFGGSNVLASANALINAYQLMVPVVTNADTAVRTSIDFLNGTSVSGSEVSYGQYGKKVTELVDRVTNKKAGLIASKINEDVNNDGGRSLKVTFEMSSAVENLSPIIDLERKSITTYANRLDNVKSSADTGALEFIPATDPDGDSGEAIYITKRVQLQNPATSIKVLFDTVRNPSANLEVMYKVLRSDDSSDFDELGWNYFNGNGSTDVPVAAVSDRYSFKEYEYTQDSIPEFIAFSIKIKMNGTNSSEPPLIKDLRAIALAL